MQSGRCIILSLAVLSCGRLDSASSLDGGVLDTSDVSSTSDPDDAGSRVDGPSDAPPVSYGTAILIPQGPFWMGCYERDGDWCGLGIGTCCGDYEGPPHEVNVPTFRIDRTEVTVAAYLRCVEAGACTPAPTYEGCNYGRPDRSSHPINCASWEHGRRFCEWAGKRFCTEAEWEKAARGGCEHNIPDCRTRMRHYPWGDVPATCEYAIMNDRLSEETPMGGCGSNTTVV